MDLLYGVFAAGQGLHGLRAAGIVEHRRGLHVFRAAKLHGAGGKVEDKHRFVLAGAVLVKQPADHFAALVFLQAGQHQSFLEHAVAQVRLCGAQADGPLVSAVIADGNAVLKGRAHSRVHIAFGVLHLDIGSRRGGVGAQQPHAAHLRALADGGTDGRLRLLGCEVQRKGRTVHGCEQVTVIVDAREGKGDLQAFGPLQGVRHPEGPLGDIAAPLHLGPTGTIGHVHESAAIIIAPRYRAVFIVGHLALAVEEHVVVFIVFLREAVAVRVDLELNPREHEAAVIVDLFQRGGQGLFQHSPGGHGDAGLLVFPHRHSHIADAPLGLRQVLRGHKLPVDVLENAAHKGQALGQGGVGPVHA